MPGIDRAKLCGARVVFLWTTGRIPVPHRDTTCQLPLSECITALFSFLYYM